MCLVSLDENMKRPTLCTCKFFGIKAKSIFIIWLCASMDTDINVEKAAGKG